MKGPFTLILCLVRHGETVANRDDILQGQCDFPLTEKGVGDAEAVGDFLRDINWDFTITSDLKRARTTAEIILSRHSDSKVTEGLVDLPLVRERSFGVRELLPRTITKKQAIKMVAERLGIPETEVVDTAETSEALLQRQRDFVGHITNIVREKLGPSIIEHTESSEGVRQYSMLCVSHGAFIRSFLADLHEFGDVGSYECREIEKIQNCSVSILKLCWEDVGELLLGAGSDSSIVPRCKIVVRDEFLNFAQHISNRDIAPLEL